MPRGSFPHPQFNCRELIKGLSSRYRCLAPENLGFGRRHVPPQVHAANLERLIAVLGPRHRHPLAPDTPPHSRAARYPGSLWATIDLVGDGG